MVLTYKCPSCGSVMVFDAESQMLTCEHCGTKKSIEEVEAEKKESAAWEESVEEAEETVRFKIYRCPSCGAEIMTDENTTAAICSFCGSPSLMEDRLEGAKKPEYVIPFSIPKEKAQEIFRKWTKRGVLTPAGFRSQSTLEKMTGMYVPYWLYDIFIRVDMSAHCTRSRHKIQGDWEYTYTDHYEVRRDVDAIYEKIPADASEKLDDETMDKLEPFDYRGMKPFEMPYLSGYVAESYDYTSTELEDRAKVRAKNYATSATRNTITGYGTVSVTREDVEMKLKKARYAMLPVWILNYRYHGKNYATMINGQTGKLVGDLPVNYGKAVGYFAGITTVLFMILSLIGGLIG